MKKFAVTLLSVVFFSVVMWAQSPTGDIIGQVVDPSGAVVPNATVKVTEKETGREVNLTTNSSGRYAALHLLPGTYTIKVDAANLSAPATQVLVQAGQVATANFAVKVGNVSTTVDVVSAPGAQIDLARSTVDGIITSKQVEGLPANQRNFLDLAALEPGVSVRDGENIDPTKAGAYRTVGVDGRSGTGTRVQVDGIDVTDETVGTTTANFSNESVQEFQLSQSSLDISTSLTSSGAISIISRSGTNTYHGSAFEFFRDNNMAARPGFSQTKVPYRRHQFGFRVGGPIIKDKLFWFANGEKNLQARQDSSNSQNFANYFAGKTCSAACFAATLFKVSLLSGRVDWNISKEVRAFYRFNHSDDLGAGGSIPFSPFQNVDWTNLHIVGLDYVHGRFTHSYRFGYVNFNNRIVSQSFAGFPFPLTPQGTPYNLSVGDLTAGPNSLAPQETDQDNFQNKYDGSLFIGKHTLRYGFEFNKIVLGGFANFAGPLSVAGDFTGGPISGSATDPLNYGLIDFSTGPNNGFFTVEPCHNLKHGCHRNNRIAWYAGDSYKLRSNFTLNLGTRWEYDTGYFNKEGSNGVKRPAYLDYFLPGASKTPQFGLNKFSPQVGFAWDPFKDGKTVIRGGAYLAYEMNIFNNLLFDQNALIPAGIGPDVFTSSFIGGPDGTPITPTSAGITTLPASCSGSSAELSQGDWSCITGNSISSVLSIIGKLDQALKSAYSSFQFNPASGTPQFQSSQGVTFGFLLGGDKFKIPYATQLNIGVQRELAKGHILSVDFLFNHGVHQGFLGEDFECRRCAKTLNVAAAQARINTVTGGAGVAAYMAANPTATINNFGLARDTVYQGRTPDPSSTFTEIKTINFLRARIVGDGGFSKYRAINVKLRGQFNKEHLHFFKDTDYQISYALSRSEATNGSTRTEFLNNAFNKFSPAASEFFGPTGLDHTHNLTVSARLGLPLGFRLGQIWAFQTAPPVDIYLDQISLTGGRTSSNAIFSNDLNGDGNVGGGGPLPDVFPGTNVGAFGRRINSISELNKVITAYNTNFAGKLTPAGQALVAAGLFTQAQLVQLKAVTPTYPLVPVGNPWPFKNYFNADINLSRPISLAKLREGMVIEPIFQVFNLFNHTGLNTYGGLNGLFGSLNYDYKSASNNATDASCQVSDAAGNSVGNCVLALAQSRGRNGNTRQMQLGIRFTF